MKLPPLVTCTCSRSSLCLAARTVAVSASFWLLSVSMGLRSAQGPRWLQRNSHHIQLPPQLSSTPFELRLNWQNLEPMSELSGRIKQHQADCSKSRLVHAMNNNGFASDVHQWSVSLCHAMELDVTLLTARAGKIFPHWIPRVPFFPNAFPNTWIWDDAATCTDAQMEQPLSCYFGTAVSPGSTCPEPTKPCRRAGQMQCVTEISDPLSGSYRKGRGERFCALGDRWHAAAVEFLFGHLAPQLVRAAQHQIPLVFGPDGIPPRSSLITVHIRWGDKGSEMDLVPVEEYVRAARAIVSDHNISQPSVYLATEDPEALRQFRKMAPTRWTVFGDPMLKADYRPDSGNHAVIAAAASRGKEGHDALVSLVLALEANHFVLTTASNWSQLMNEIRKNVLNPRCGGCTTMVDLMSKDEMCTDYRREQQKDEMGKSLGFGGRAKASWLGPKWATGKQRQTVLPPPIERFYAQESLCHVWK